MTVGHCLSLPGATLPSDVNLKVRVERGGRRSCDAFRSLGGPRLHGSHLGHLTTGTVSAEAEVSVRNTESISPTFLYYFLFSFCTLLLPSHVRKKSTESTFSRCSSSAFKTSQSHLRHFALPAFLLRPRSLFHGPTFSWNLVRLTIPAASVRGKLSTVRLPLRAPILLPSLL